MRPGKAEAEFVRGLLVVRYLDAAMLTRAVTALDVPRERRCREWLGAVRALHRAVAALAQVRHAVTQCEAGRTTKRMIRALDLQARDERFACGIDHSNFLGANDATVNRARRREARVPLKLQPK